MNEFYFDNSLVLLTIVNFIGLIFLLIVRNGKYLTEVKKNRNLEAPKNWFLILPLVFMPPLITYDAYNMGQSIKINKINFDNGEKLRCNTFGNTYIVSKEDNWKRIEDGYKNKKTSLYVSDRSCSD